MGVLARNREDCRVKELLRTNDAVLLSYVEALLGEAEIEMIVADRFMSVVEGSLGVLPTRVLVREEDHLTARRLLSEADLRHMLTPLKD